MHGLQTLFKYFNYESNFGLKLDLKAMKANLVTSYYFEEEQKCSPQGITVAQR